MTNQAKKLFALLGFALPLSTGALAVAETKVGYVDLQRALQEVNDARSAKTRLQTTVDEKKKKFEREQADLLKEKDAFEKQMGVMTADAKAQRQSDLGKKVYDLNQRWEKEKVSFQEQEQSEMKAIFAKMNPIIASIAAREGMSFVFDKTDGGILYAPAYLDITNELVRLYNDQKAGKGKGDLKPTRVTEPKAGSGKKK
ncbi:MAG TPA: OmpH family outer membrane protein [Myxococcaceae bacterium]|nr:OmpH family outer membrane protein [Myxococcaceae bacterium]